MFLPVGASVYIELAGQGPEEGVGAPGIGVTDSCKLPCGSWELNLGLPEEHPVLLPAGSFP